MDTRKLSFRLLSVLTCAVSILLLAAACASAASTPTPTAAPKPTATATPTAIPTLIPTATPEPTATLTPEPTPTPIKMRACTDIPCDEMPTVQQIVHVFEKYGPIIRQDPEWHGLGEWYFMDGNGDWDTRKPVSIHPGRGWTDFRTHEHKYGIVVKFSLREESEAAGLTWIPHCIEGVPIQVHLYVGNIEA